MKIALSALVLAFAATGALADSPTPAGLITARPASGLTRAEVIEQVMQARAAGTLPKAGDLDQVPAPMVSVRTREEVKSEVLRTHPQGSYVYGIQPW